jgi:hypothetical protein
MLKLTPSQLETFKALCPTGTKFKRTGATYQIISYTDDKINMLKTRLYQQNNVSLDMHYVYRNFKRNAYCNLQVPISIHDIKIGDTITIDSTKPMTIPITGLGNSVFSYRDCNGKTTYSNKSDYYGYTIYKHISFPELEQQLNKQLNKQQDEKRRVTKTEQRGEKGSRIEVPAKERQVTTGQRYIGNRASYSRAQAAITTIKISSSVGYK